MQRNQQKVVHCGWLTKQGGNLLKNYRMRWFELKGDILYYQKEQGDGKPLGEIMLPGNQIIKHPVDPQNDPGRYKMEILPGNGKVGPINGNHETYLLSAQSEAERDKWVQVIERIIYAPLGGGMFGRNLAETVLYEQKKTGGYIPVFVERCVEFIREKGLSEEGLFRLPGHQKQVSILRDAFNRGKDPTLPDDTDVHTVASLLKMYLRELPEPVIPFENFGPLIATIELYELHEEDALRKILNQLAEIPKTSYNLLKYLCRFLNQVHENSKENKMTADNLALVFGPNILSPESEADPHVLMESSTMITKLTKIFICKQHVLFKKTKDEEEFLQRRREREGNLIDLSYMDSSGSPTINSGFDFNMIQSTCSDINSNSIDAVGAKSDNEAIAELEHELEIQRRQYEAEISALTSKLEDEKKIRSMLELRLQDEKRARVDLEKRLQFLENGIDELVASMSSGNEIKERLSVYTEK
ncbi:rho GTPase-activating protein 24-like isoform X2 [Xenia sp. Carnegie-2017]|uniref:rho GTPase-activating protein 24-like isoform X2 n=1 Tax=Xenia sp. Carnegie-2017 TaxID=2897299 RepID=UPI001F046CAE|nr:rho GTPase-activating protein 24-like isoform X2 [Xenia sp. Carnegie-2017]